MGGRCGLSFYQVSGDWASGRTMPSRSSDLVGAAPPVCSDLLERAYMTVLVTFTDNLVPFCWFRMIGEMHSCYAGSSSSAF